MDEYMYRASAFFTKARRLVGLPSPFCCRIGSILRSKAAAHWPLSFPEVFPRRRYCLSCDHGSTVFTLLIIY